MSVESYLGFPILLIWVLHPTQLLQQLQILKVKLSAMGINIEFVHPGNTTFFISFKTIWTQGSSQSHYWEFLSVISGTAPLPT